MRISWWPLAALIALLAAPAWAASWQAAPTALDIGGETGNRRTLAVGLSDDGRYALLQSEASDVGGGAQGNGPMPDVFVYDAQLGSLQLVSHWNGEPDAEAGGWAKKLSQDGRYVLYESPWNSLTRAQATVSSGAYYAYVHDRTTGVSELVSHAAGEPGNAVFARALDMTEDGRWVLFASYYPTVVPGFVRAPEGGMQLYLHDRHTATAQLVSHSHLGATRSGNALTLSGKVSPDGRYVAYTSGATNLVEGAGGWGDQVYRYDRTTGTNLLVSRTVDAANDVGDGPARLVGLSADGETLAYATSARDVLAGSDSNGSEDFYLFDAPTGTPILATRSADSPTQTANGPSITAHLSANGRFLVFSSVASDLAGAPQVASDVHYDVFVFDRVSLRNTLLSHAAGAADTPANGHSVAFSIAPDGSHVIFGSRAGDLLAGTPSAARAAYRTFVLDLDGARTTELRGEDEFAWFGNAVATPDASHVLFHSASPGIVPGLADHNGQNDTFLLERETGTLTLTSRAVPSVARRTPNYSLSAEALSADGRHVLLRGSSTNFLTGLDNRRGMENSNQLDPGDELFLHDRQTGESMLVNHRKDAPGVTLLVGSTESWRMSRDGGVVEFASTWMTNGRFKQNYVFDRAERSHGLLTHAAGQPQSEAQGDSEPGPMTPDGRWITFGSKATDLEAGQGDYDGMRDVFIHDRVTDTTQLLTRRQGSTTVANGESTPRGISDDGVWILFETRATNLVPAIVDGNYVGHDVYLRNRVDGSFVLVTRSAAQPDRSANRWSNALALSSDGRYVVFSSTATDLVAGLTDANGDGDDLFVFDRHTGLTRTVSRARESHLRTLATPSTFVQASLDGRFVLFLSADPAASAAQDTNGGNDVFLFDAASGEVELVSRGASGGTPSMASDQPMMSEDGRWIAYRSAAPDVAGGASDANAATDVFVYDSLTARTSLVSHLPNDWTTSLPKPSSPAGITADGRTVLVNTASPVVADGVFDDNERSDAFAMRRGATVRWTVQGSGALTPGGIRFVPLGEGVAYQAVAAAGHKLVAIEGCGGTRSGTDFNVAVVEDDCVIEARFRPFHVLAYRAGAGGQLSGEVRQEVFEGESGTAVTAIPARGRIFAAWSDGSVANPRIEAAVSAALDVEAGFLPSPDVILIDGFE